MKKYILSAMTNLDAEGKGIIIRNGKATVWARDARTAASKLCRFLAELGIHSYEWGRPRKRGVIKTSMRRAARNAAKRSENPTAAFKAALKLGKGGSDYLFRHATFLSFGKKSLYFD